MAEKRRSIKKVSAEQLALGIYHATFEDAAKTEVKADLRQLFASPDLYEGLAPMVKKTLQYGIKQKLDDSMADVEDVADAIAEVTSTWEAIVKGEWATRVPGEGVEGGLFAKAYAQWKNISLADAKAAISRIITKNLVANREKYKDDKKKLESITEKAVYVRVRLSTLERNADLNTVYEELKAKRKQRAATRTEMEIDTADVPDGE